MLPDQCHHHRRHRHAHGVLDVHGAELAALDATAQHPREQPADALHDFVEEEPRRLREIGGFGYHELREARDARLVHVLPPAAHHLGQQVPRRAAVRLDPLLGALKERNDVLPHRRLEQRFLALEIEVQRPLRHPGALRHVLESGGREAILDERFQCGVQDVAGPLLRHAPAAGRW